MHSDFQFGKQSFSRTFFSRARIVISCLLMLTAFTSFARAQYGAYGSYGSVGAAKTPAAIGTALSPTASITPAPIAPPPSVITSMPPLIDPYSISSSSSPTFAPKSANEIIPQTYQQAKRFRDRTSLEFLYLAPNTSGEKLGMTELDARCQFAIPLKCIPSNSATGMEMPYLYLAPGASFSWWQMGELSPFGKEPKTFSAYLDSGIQPHLNKDLWLDAWVRVGVFSDYKKVTNDSVRVMGRVMGMFTVSPEWEAALGVIYLNRQHIRLLPSGGLIWRPNDDTVVKIVFPDPKISKRFKATGTADFWLYAQGGYGGGVWTMQDVFGVSAATDYNDIRLGIGLEMDSRSSFGGFLEFGGAFDRELYRSSQAKQRIDNTWYLRAGLVF